MKVTVNSTPQNRISINNQSREIIRAVNVVPEQPGTELRTLNDVNASNLVTNHTIVYEAGTDKFVVKELPIVNGGTF